MLVSSVCLLRKPRKEKGKEIYEILITPNYVLKAVTFLANRAQLSP